MAKIEALKDKGGIRKRPASSEPLTLANTTPPQDPDSKADEHNARAVIKKALSKLQDKLPDIDMIKTSIGKSPDRIGAMVLQQASELKVIMKAHINRLQKMAVMSVDKVSVAEFKDVATTAAKVLEDL